MLGESRSSQKRCRCCSRIVSASCKPCRTLATSSFPSTWRATRPEASTEHGCRASTGSVTERGVVLALDEGTTGATAVVVGLDGEVKGKAYREISQHFPQPGWV